MRSKKKTRILLYSIHYYPEMIGISVFNTQMAEYLASKGYEVTVITAMPWYPYWKVMDGYRGILKMTERINGVTVKRSYVYSPAKVSAVTRILHELVFTFSSLVNLVPQFFKKVDLVFTVCPPLELGLVGNLFARLKSAPTVFHVQDLQVDAAFDMGMLKSRRLFSILGRVERSIMKSSTLVTTISNGMKRKIESKGIAAKQVELLPNWIDINKIRPMNRINRFREEYGFSKEKFIVLYAGNIGEKQGVGIVMDVADATRSYIDIHYVIVGEGANSERLKAMAKERNLENVTMLPLQSTEMLPCMLAAADISLIIQKRSVGDIVMPSKLLNIMASERPVVATASKECELARFIEQVECGLVVEPEVPGKLMDAVIGLYDDKDFATECAQRGRAYAVEHLSINSVLSRFENRIEQLVEGAS